MNKRQIKKRAKRLLTQQIHRDIVRAFADPEHHLSALVECADTITYSLLRKDESVIAESTVRVRKGKAC